MRPSVMYVIDTLAVGGTERSVVEIAKKLRAVDVCVVTLFGDEPLGPELRCCGIPVVDLDVPRKSMWRAVRPLRALTRRRSPDVVHSLLFKSDVASRLALAGNQRSRLVNTFVNDSYGIARWRGSSAVAAAGLARVLLLDRATARCVDVFTSNSRAVARSNAGALGLDLDAIRVIHRGRDLARYAVDPTDRRQQRAALGWPDDITVIVNVARLLARKRQVLLIEALARLSPSSILVFVGDGPERTSLSRTAERLGIGSRVHFLGTRFDVDKILGAADIFAFPSAYEGFPGALVEAMASGLPIVASDIEVHREATTATKECAELVVDDPQAWAVALGRLVVDPAKRTRLGRAAQQASAHFAIDGVAAAHDRLYVELTGSSARRRSL